MSLLFLLNRAAKQNIVDIRFIDYDLPSLSQSEILRKQNMKIKFPKQIWLYDDEIRLHFYV